MNPSTQTNITGAPLAPTNSETRLDRLEAQLRQENPILLTVVPSFRKLDQVAHRMGLLARDQSFATQISWWPMIAVLGTYSAGKSSFINAYLGLELQRTGSQAVDDKFSVICYGQNQEPQVLPGVALDADIRFPFFRISAEIDKVAAGEGRRIDTYLQLKTCRSEPLIGKILIDSPGFDADAQRTSTLRITEHIIDLSDLVLVLFDARHPEPGAMRDTLQHLVASAVNRPDIGKFLWILNQLDTVAREDNAEAVVAAWQRALAEKGLHTTRFYTIFNRPCAVPIADPVVRARYDARLEQDLGEIKERMRQVEVSRSYRIVNTLEKTARYVRDEATPALTQAIARWRRMVLKIEAVLLLLLAGTGAWVMYRNGWGWFSSTESEQGTPFLLRWWMLAAGIALVLAAVVVHMQVRRFAARWVRNRLPRLRMHGFDALANAFDRSTRWSRSLWLSKPAGAGSRAVRLIEEALSDSAAAVQALNDHYANPSGAPRPGAALRT